MKNYVKNYIKVTTARTGETVYYNVNQIIKIKDVDADGIGATIYTELDKIGTDIKERIAEVIALIDAAQKI